MSHLHSQPHPPDHCLGRCYSFKARVNPFLFDGDKKKILVQRQTENDCSFQFSVCLSASIFCLSLNNKTNANKCESLDSWGRMENQTEIQRGIYKRQMENQNLETNRKCLFLHPPSAVKAFTFIGICFNIKGQTKNWGSETNRKLKWTIIFCLSLN